jgi:hypothetical protein
MIPDLIESLFTPPAVVVPITGGAIVGYIFVLALGAAILWIGGTYASSAGGRSLLVPAFGAYVMAISEVRFLRAVAPDNTALAWILYAISYYAIPVFGLLGLGASIGIDRVQESMGGIPLPWGVPIFGALLLLAYAKK